MKFIRSLISHWIFGRISDFRKHLEQSISSTQSSHCQIRLRGSWGSFFTRYRYRLSPTIPTTPQPAAAPQSAFVPSPRKTATSLNGKLVLRAPAVGKFHNPDNSILGRHQRGDKMPLMEVLELPVEIELKVIWLALGDQGYRPIEDFPAIRVIEIFPNHGDTIEWGQELCLVEIVQQEADNET